MFRKEVFVMAAIVIVPFVVGLAFVFLYPWLKARGYVG
jgi:hypothetical protein